MVDSYDALVDLLEAIEHLFKLFNVYTKVPRTSALDELAIKIMVELLSILALATKDLKQGRLSEFFYRRYITQLGSTQRNSYKEFLETSIPKQS